MISEYSNKRKMKAEHTEVAGIYLTVNFVGFKGYAGEKEMSKTIDKEPTV